MSPHRRIAHVASVDDDDNEIESSTTYATSSIASPTKEKGYPANTGKFRRGTRRESLSNVVAFADPESTGPSGGGVSLTRRDVKKSSSKSDQKEHREHKEHKEHREHREHRERREQKESKERPSATKKVTLQTRPQARHSKTAPGSIDTALSRRRAEEASYYGVQDVTPASSAGRQRMSQTPRPTSCYGPTSRPPLSTSAYWQHHYPQTPTSYPPQPWVSHGSVVYPNPQPSPIIAAPAPTEYFPPVTPNVSHLHNRFNLARPQTTLGYRPQPAQPPPPPSYPQDDYVPGDPVRRRSVSRRTTLDEAQARAAMPPPPRPQSARPTMVALAPPPAYPPRRPFGEDDLAGDDALFQDVSPGSYAPPSSYNTVIRSRRLSIGAGSPYDPPSVYHVEDRSGRRRSYFDGGGPGGLAWEDKLKANMAQASSYQAVVEGGPALPLTAEALRKASKTSSRSTRSSASRDESDYRQSATTRTTRSSDHDEDITIKLTGSGILKVGGTELHCKEGAEVSINRGVPTSGGRSHAGGSDRSSSVYDDHDSHREGRRVSRIERPANSRSRASSQSGSYSRTPSSYTPTDFLARVPAYYQYQ